jgi:hypothetical protein
MTTDIIRHPPGDIVEAFDVIDPCEDPGDRWGRVCEEWREHFEYTRVFGCDRCNRVRTIATGHPCPFCMNPEFHLLLILPDGRLVSDDGHAKTSDGSPVSPGIPVGFKVCDVRLYGRSMLENGLPNFVYVGRAVPRQGWAESPWHNPFRKESMGVTPVASYEASWRATIVWSINAREDDPRWSAPFPSLLRRLPELAGKILGCWCVDWDGVGEPATPCHAVVLSRLVKAYTGE